mmetsp:Transcript_16733/g.39728  ORF Transcript_16733/g.39728 Transcript_16733/m.39728 type:complete len:254 (-) Transcript_16733:191-952(-)
MSWPRRCRSAMRWNGSLPRNWRRPRRTRGGRPECSTSAWRRGWKRSPSLPTTFTWRRQHHHHCHPFCRRPAPPRAEMRPIKQLPPAPPRATLIPAASSSPPPPPTPMRSASPTASSATSSNASASRTPSATRSTSRRPRSPSCGPRSGIRRRGSAPLPRSWTRGVGRTSGGRCAGRTAAMHRIPPSSPVPRPSPGAASTTPRRYSPAPLVSAAPRADRGILPRAGRDILPPNPPRRGACDRRSAPPPHAHPFT